MLDSQEMIKTAQRLSVIVSDAASKLAVIQVGGSYSSAGPALRDGDCVVKIRLRLAPRLKIGVAVNLGTDVSGYDVRAVAAAISALLEMPVSYQHMTVGAQDASQWSLIGSWANNGNPTFTINA